MPRSRIATAAASTSRSTAARLLAPHGDRAGYLDHAIPHKKRKELRRLRKRLADAGTLTSTTTADPSALTAALLDFLALEASGWKGRAGTAAQAQRRRPLLRASRP